MRWQHRKQRYTKTNAFIQWIKGAFREVFDNPVGRPAKKVLVTVAGVFIILLGILLIVLPGPAFLLIPVGLAILATEYTFARKWLRKFQHWMTVYAKKADAFIERRKAKS